MNKLILKKFKYQGGFPKREGRWGKGFWSFKFMMHDVIVLKDVSLYSGNQVLKICKPLSQILP